MDKPLWTRKQYDQNHKMLRYSRDVEYMGVNYQAKDSLSVWRDEINLKRWRGRPYSRFEYDEVYLYAQEVWQSFVDKALAQGAATNREVVQGADYLYLCPIWKHTPKVAA